MLKWLNDLKDAISATSIDPAIEQSLPAVDTGEKDLGELPEEFKKAYCHIEHERGILDEFCKSMETMAANPQRNNAKLAKLGSQCSEQMNFLETLSEIFHQSLWEYVAKNQDPLIWNDEISIEIREGWRIVKVLDQIDDDENEAEDDQEENLAEDNETFPGCPSIPPEKKRMH